MNRFSVLVALVSSAAFAQSGVKQYLDSAETQNVDRRITIEQRNRAAAEYRQAWTALFPSVSASGGWTHNQYEATANFPNPATGEITKLVIVPGDQLDAAIRFEVPLIDTTRWMRAAAAGASESGAEQREAVMRDLVKRQVVAAYYGYAATLAVRESSKKSAAVAEQQLKLMEVRASAGAVTELDLLRAKSEMQRTRQVIADTESLVATSRRTLRTLSGIEPPESLPEQADDTRPAQALAELEARINELPAVKAADADAAAAGRLATASKLALIPSISAQYTQRFTNATGFQGQVAVYNAGINFLWRLDVPTFMGMQVASANEATAELSGERARLVARDQVNTDWQRLKAALTKIEAARAQVEAAQRAAQVARDRYAVGAATQVDVIQAERDLFGAEVNHIQSRTELATARASLQLSAALPLE